MKRLVAAAALLIACAPASAGLHLPASKDDPKDKPLPATADAPMPFLRLDDALTRPRRYALEVAGDTTRADGLKEAAALQAKGSALSAEERLRLTGLLLRLRDYAGAQAAFRQGTPAEQADWRMLANRALASFGEGDALAAWRDQSAALDAMRGASAWEQKVEQTQKDLFRARAKEAKAGGAQDQPDDLFGLKFVGPSGEYEAGAIADTDPARLAEATALAQHLLFATPEDARLWWLLAELYNARGDIEAAARILDECVDSRRVGWPDLFAHRRVIKAEAARRAYVPPPPSILPTGPRLWAGAAVVVLIVFLVGLQVRMNLRRPRTRGRA